MRMHMHLVHVRMGFSSDICLLLAYSCCGCYIRTVGTSWKAPLPTRATTTEAISAGVAMLVGL